MSGETAALQAWIDSVNQKLSPPLPPGVVQFQADFTQPPANYGFQLQARDPSRASIGTWSGRPGVKLTTLPGDNNIAGSGDMQRCDLLLPQNLSNGFEGQNQWWSWSVLFPDDFQWPRWHHYVLFDFHQTGNVGLVPFILGFTQATDPTAPGILGCQIGTGVGLNQPFITANQLQRNVWYDFVFNVQWSSTNNGYFNVWMNGVQQCAYNGPTMWAGQGVYLKLANYHNPVCDPYPACIGTDLQSSVVHGKVVRSSTLSSLGFTASLDWHTLLPISVTLGL